MTRALSLPTSGQMISGGIINGLMMILLLLFISGAKPSVFLWLGVGLALLCLLGLFAILLYAMYTGDRLERDLRCIGLGLPIPIRGRQEYRARLLYFFGRTIHQLLAKFMIS